MRTSIPLLLLLACYAAGIGRSNAVSPQVWGRGFEGQRKADLGNGYYLNPIMPGDHPDPSILKDGADYHMTFFVARPSPASCAIVESR